MEKHYDLPDSPAWHARRNACFNAGDAAAMLGCSPYKTRSQLLDELHTGIVREFSDYAQEHVISPGHRIEALCRPIGEEIIGEELQVLAATLAVEGLSRPLGASLDGLTFMEDVVWECKSINDELRAAMPHDGRDSHKHNDGKALPKDKRVQMEQQLKVTNAKRTLFSAARFNKDGTVAEERHAWYYPDPALRAEIIAGWKQFAIDLAAYKPTAAAPVVTAQPVPSLPAVNVRVDGTLAVISNLPDWAKALHEFIAKIPAKPASEQEFADAEAAVKALKKAEEALDAAEAGALGQIASVEQMTRMVSDLRTLAKTTRLATNTMVAARKVQIRTEEIQRGKEAFAAHIDSLNTRLGKPFMPVVPVDFAGAIAGKKNIDSLRNAIDSELARAKIAASEIADAIDKNLQFLREHAREFAFLFHDTPQIILKAHDDLQVLVRSRIAEHKAAEQKKADDLREQIRAEEQAKAEKEAREKLAAEQREAAAVKAEEDRKAAEAAKPAATPAPEVVHVGSVGSHLAELPVLGKLVSKGGPGSGEFTFEPNPNVVPLGTRAPAPESTATIRLGQINERLAPIQLTAEGLASLGFNPVATEKNAKLFREADLPRIYAALVAHIDRVRQPMAA